MTKQCEILDTITIDNELWQCNHSFANTDGMIFLLQRDGKVYNFDPFGEKQLAEILDLNED